MEEYVSESQQIEQIKGWATTNGPWLLAGVAAVVVAFAGFNQWKRWQESKAVRASENYTQLLNALSRDDRAGATKLADALRADYGRTPYADQADLALARALVEANLLPDAEARLTLVVGHSHDDALRLLARYRLARVQRAEGHPDVALKTLAAEPASGFAAAYAEVRGDIAADRGDSALALKEYQAAEAGAGDDLVNHDVLDLKIIALGGTPAADKAATAVPVAGVSP